jgi:hypothetical protein
MVPLFLFIFVTISLLIIASFTVPRSHNSSKANKSVTGENVENFKLSEQPIEFTTTGHYK